MTTTPAGPARPAVEVLKVEEAGDGRLVILARCWATTHLGACFRHVTSGGDVIDLTLTEIHRYAGVEVPLLEPPDTGRLVFSGTGVDGLRIEFRDVLHGIDNPAT